MKEALDDHELRGLSVCLANHGVLTQLYVFMSSYASMTCSFLALSEKHTTKLEIVSVKFCWVLPSINRNMNASCKSN